MESVEVVIRSGTDWASRDFPPGLHGIQTPGLRARALFFEPDEFPRASQFETISVRLALGEDRWL